MAFIPKIILAIGLALWSALGGWVVLHAPFASGTDESISYVAFAAAKNRWATEADFRSAGIEGFYYPPLYFLCFAPFYGDDPAFVEQFPRGQSADPNYEQRAGRVMVSADYLARVPPSLERLYRHAKLFSLALGLAVLLCLVVTLRFLVSGPSRWWLVLLGTAPLLFLPQFLYYQTLCNNDTLVNALSAVAICSFVAALCALEEGRRRRFTILSLATAASIGLALFTKMSGFALLPLLPGLAVASALAPGAGPFSSRVRRALLHFFALLATAFAGGGWWILYKAGQGDWDSMKAHLLAHPWAFGTPISPGDVDRLFQRLIFSGRSYYAMFNGLLDIGVPDSLFIAALLVPTLWCINLVVVLVRGGFKKLRTGFRSPDLCLRTLLWSTLSAVFLLNILLVVIYVLRGMDAGEYGRFLFPSLVASHAIFTGLLAQTLSTRPRWAALVGLAVTVYCGGLFGWAFTTRMADAVAQPREDVRILFAKRSTTIPIEHRRITQQFSVPPGELTGFRIKLVRSNQFPQIGARLEGNLRFRRSGGPWQQVPLQPVAIGDFDNCRRWVEISLSTPISLPERTDVSLSLVGKPPHSLFSFVRFFYVLGFQERSNWRDGVILDGGPPADLALCLAAVYSPRNESARIVVSPRP